MHRSFILNFILIFFLIACSKNKVGDYQASNQINPYGNPDPTKKFSDDTFEINKKIVENNQICSFELVNTIDSEDLTLPRNQITKDRFPAAGSFVFV